MSEPLRVAMVESVGGHRGNDGWLYNLCAGLHQRGCAVQLFTSDETEFPSRPAPAADSHSITTGFGHNKAGLPFELHLTYKRIYGTDNKFIRGLRYLKGGFNSARIASRLSADVAHVHIYHFALREYLNALQFKRRGMALVMTVHDVEDFVRYGKRINPRGYRKFERLADGVIVHSHYAKERLLRHFTRTAPDDIAVTPLPDYDSLYDNPALTKADARRQLGLPQDQFIVLFFGQIKKVKGLDVLMRGFANIKGNDAQLLVAGIPWKVSESDYTGLVEKLGIGHRIILRLSYHPPGLKHVYFKAADVAVLPYREIYSSGVLVNALYYGTPLITSDKPLFKEYLRNGHDCLMFENENAGSLTNALEQLYSDAALVELLKINAQKTFAKTFTADKAAEQTMTVYESACRRKKTTNGLRGLF